MMDNFLTILNEVWINGLLGVSMTKIIVSIAVLLLSFLLRGFVVTVVISSIEKLAKSTESKLDDEILKAVKKTSKLCSCNYWYIRSNNDFASRGCCWRYIFKYC